MKRSSLIKLLKIEAKNECLICSLESIGIELEPLRVDLLEVVLDELGVPPDNTLELKEKYGKHAYDRPDLMCRDCFTEKWIGVLNSGREEGIEGFLDWVEKEVVKFLGTNN